PHRPSSASAARAAAGSGPGCAAGWRPRATPGWFCPAWSGLAADAPEQFKRFFPQQLLVATGFHIQADYRLGIGFAQIETPVAEIQRQAIDPRYIVSGVDITGLDILQNLVGIL